MMKKWYISFFVLYVQNDILRILANTNTDKIAEIVGGKIAYAGQFPHQVYTYTRELKSAHLISKALQ